MMRRMSLLLALVTLALSTTGCNCFRKRQQVVTQPPMAVCQPMVCPPVCCDPCATPQAVSYGMPATGFVPAQ